MAQCIGDQYRGRRLTRPGRCEPSRYAGLVDLDFATVSFVAVSSCH
jgi:hypothetical protein